MIKDVLINKAVLKELSKLPTYISEKLLLWIDDIKEVGLEQVRTRSGYHDEPLKGKRQGQRSIRLNRSYRAIYVIRADGKIEFIEVIEVNKHDY